MDPREQHALEQHALGLEHLAFARLPRAMCLVLVFIAGVLPIELYYYPEHRDTYLAVLAFEALFSAASYVWLRLQPTRARAIAIAWASVMAICVAAYYPLSDGDVTLSVVALICMLSAMPAVLPFGPVQQLVLCAVCVLAFAASIVGGVESTLPWPYLLVALLAVGALTTIGASSLAGHRLEAMHREAVLRQAHENLRVALARAESAVETRSRMVANVSHELRTPVNVIVGYADMVLDAASDEKLVRNLTRRIREYAVSLDTLISQLLDLSRLSSGKVELSDERIDLRQMLDDVAHDARLLTRGLPIAVVADCQVPEVMGDAIRLRQILNNLVTNAARATRSGRIEIAAREQDDWLVLTVSDTGCGIPPDKQASIFDAFVQLGNAPGGASGIGLGLAIVRQLTDLLGGTVGVTSAPGEGSTFSVRLPLRRPVRPVDDATRDERDGDHGARGEAAAPPPPLGAPH
ncbi:MAG TPA: HAMP domain-containing sensor histidine kinase [Candidatus Binatia bacterium]